MKLELLDGGIHADGVKIATYGDGRLRMARGHAARREEVELWLEEILDLQADPPAPPPCPPEDPRAGSKTPEVVAWHAKYGSRSGVTNPFSQPFPR